MSTFPKLKLTYFNASGRAEAIRLAFYLGNVPFEDYRFSSFQQFGELKATFPFAQVPVLEIDGEVFAQSQALLRYAGRVANLYPVNDSLAALKIDEILGGLEELSDKMTPSFFEQDPEKKKAMRDELAQVTIPRYLKLVTARLAKLQEYAVFQTDSIFIHDLVIFALVRQLRSGLLDHIPTDLPDAYPAILAIEAKVTNNKKVKEWYANPRNVAPKLKLTYFNAAGRAEPIRLAFHIGGVAFEDNRIERSVLNDIRESLPFGQLPVLEVNGEVISQSLQLLRYAGSLSGLYPTTDFVQALRIDEIFCLIDEMFNNIGPSYRIADPEKQLEVRQHHAAVTIPKFIGGMNKRAEQWGGPYATGAQLTIADLAIYALVQNLTSGLVGFPTTMCDAFTHIIRIRDLVLDHPKVKEWNQMSH